MKLFLAIVLIAAVSAKEFAVTQNIIDEINSSGASWTAGHNKFSNMTVDEVKALMGTRTGYAAKASTLRKNHFQSYVTANLPTNYDWRDNTDCKSVHNILNQEQCGSCWAFGATEALSDRLCIQSGGKVSVQLAPQQLVSCDHTCRWLVECDQGCNGGIPIVAWDFMQKTGVPSDTCYPYTSGGGDSGECKAKCTDGSDKKMFKAKSHYTVSSSDEAIKTEILTNGPVEGAFSVYKDFMSYTGGVYVHKTGAKLGGHAIRILGWGNEGGVDYWLCANSWGPSWGLKGAFKIKTGDCGMNDDVVAGMADV